MDSNEFVESLRVGKGSISPELRSEITAILQGKKTIKEVCDLHRGDPDFPKDPKGIKRKMAILVEQDEKIEALYNKYIQRGNSRPRGYDYIPEIIDMLENDLSQRKTAEKHGISRETIKTAIERVRDEELKKLIKTHSDRHALGRNCPNMTLKEERDILAYKQKYLQQKEAKQNGQDKDNNPIEQTGKRGQNGRE